ncbi:MAG: glycosyltransferase family 39 protein [Alphaproteobacteria bacterium]|nr:glycosyltransferase family 39 protein [Alphaproteobacteria bacterium]
MENKLLKSIIILDIIGLILSLFMTDTLSVDGFEHMKMSYFITNGYVPYRDFFEHHHPLLWYIYAPIMFLLPHNYTLAYYVSRIFSLICSSIMLFIIAKTIKRFLGGEQKIYYFLAILFMFFPIWQCFSTLKPDIITRIFYFLGVYYFFCYAEKLQTKDMVYCGLSFTIAFLALQNIIFSIIPLIVPTWILLDKNHKVFKDILISSLFPLLIIFAVVILLVFSDTWNNYFQLNWIFNSQLFDYMHYTDSSLLYYWTIPILIGIGAWIWQIKSHSSSFYLNTIGLLLVAEVVQHIYFKAVFNHYLVIMFIFIAILSSSVVSKVKNKFINVTMALFAVVIFLLNLNYIHEKDTQQLSKMHALEIKENDQIFNIDFRYINIYSPKISYYSLFHALTLIDNTIFNRYPDYDTSKFIEAHKIKYIDYIYTPMNNIVYDGADNLKRFYISDEVLQKYDEILPGLWRRKEEYQ